VKEDLMTTARSLHALRRANPRVDADFPRSVAAVRHAVQQELAPPAAAATAPAPSLRRSLAGLAAVVAVGAAAGVALLAIGPPGGSVEDAAAAVRQAAAKTAASASDSGTVSVQITNGGHIWAAESIRWHGGNLAVERDAPERSTRKPGSVFLLVDGLMYGIDVEDGGWAVMGRPESIDPDSGTTPSERLAAIREDIGGATLRRLTAAMGGPTTRRHEDGTTVYTGPVPAGRVAREEGFKDGQPLRVLPFGYVANGEAADPSALVDASITVGPDGLVREISASWGSGASSWIYTVTYSGLGTTPSPVVPAEALARFEREACAADQHGRKRAAAVAPQLWRRLDC
jgi:hypothetical protein